MATNDDAQGAGKDVEFTESTAKREAYVVARRSFLRLEEECRNMRIALETAVDRLKPQTRIFAQPDPLRTVAPPPMPGTTRTERTLPTAQQVDEAVIARRRAAEDMITMWKNLSREEQNDSPDLPEALKNSRL